MVRKDVELQMENALEQMISERSYRILQTTNFEYSQVTEKTYMNIFNNKALKLNNYITFLKQEQLSNRISSSSRASSSGSSSSSSSGQSTSGSGSSSSSSEPSTPKASSSSSSTSLAPSSSQASSATSGASSTSMDPSAVAPSDESSDDDEKEFGKFKSHLEFVKMIRDAQTMANETKSKVPFTWRGYKSSVFPDLPPFTKKVLWDRLKNALKGVFDITVHERQLLAPPKSAPDGCSAVAPNFNLPFKIPAKAKKPNDIAGLCGRLISMNLF